ncbi:UNVERIFIED_CONTAM: hypothetical protein GTU68_007856, partial [Idotea baltica]|nr:hypothetical protein [Idotea baltica]
MSSKDQRRIQGPEKTSPFSIFQQSKPLKFANKDNMRHDGRSPVDVQKLFMTLDIISQAKGSSFIEAGDTKVVCGVYGPREVQRGTDFKLTGQVSCEVKFAPFSSKVRKSPQPDRSQKEISRQLKEALETVIIVEKFPKAQIDVHITVIECGGSLLSTCLTAAGLALCHASIDVYDLVIGADVIWREGMSYVNPSQHELDC